MNDELNWLKVLAKSVYGKLRTDVPYSGFLSTDDAMLSTIQNVSVPAKYFDEVNEAASIMRAEPLFTDLFRNDDTIGPMHLTVFGGVRTSLHGVLLGMLTSARIHMFLSNMLPNVETFVSKVLDNYEQLRLAVGEETVRAYLITGIGGISISGDNRATTPWGVLQSVMLMPPHLDSYWSGRVPTKCILIEERQLSIKFDTSNRPEHDFSSEERRAANVDLLFPLCCVLSTVESGNIAVSIETWSMCLLPFHGGLTSFYSNTIPWAFAETDVSDSLDEIERVSNTISGIHSPSIEIAARRLVSAVAHRKDSADSLIDAVTVWENLLGAESEVSFRVTAALAKLLESNVNTRKELQKELKKIYDLRSRIVHGAKSKPEDVNEAAKTAIKIAAKALSEFYRLGDDWLALSSVERANFLILESP